MTLFDPTFFRNVSAAGLHIIWCAVLLAMTTPASADGKFFRAETVARDPSIPHQSALIVHRDGEQTMIVQSAVDAEGDAVGWILPLPAEPTSIELVTPGVLKTLDLLIEPSVIDARSAILAVVIAAGCMLGSFVTYAGARYYRRIERPMARLARVVAIFWLASLFFTVVFVVFAASGLGRARGALASDGVDISMEVRAGAYDVTVLTADSADQVCTWLNINGFICDPDAIPVLDSYINEGWCFAAAQIRADGADLLEPHPLQVAFPSQAPIYPMRLTGVGATDPLELDLYIISEYGATAAGLDIWRRDVLLRDGSAVDEHHGPAVVYDGETTRLAIGHPQITTLLWNGCTLTHLRGTLAPQQVVRDDVHIAPTAGGAYRRTFYTRAARDNCVVAAVFGALAVASLFATVCAAQPTVRVPRAAAWSAGVGIALGVTAVSVVYLFVPVTATEAARSSLYHRVMSGRLVRTVDDAHTAADPEANRDIVDALRAGAYGERPAADVPHGMIVDDLDDAWRVTVYDYRAVPTTWQLAKPGD